MKLTFLQNISKSVSLLLILCITSSAFCVAAGEDAPFVKNLYFGNDLTAQENGYDVMYVANHKKDLTYKAYDATAVGGDSKAIYSKINVGKIYMDAAATSYAGIKFGGVVAYSYDEAIGNQHMSKIDVSSILNTGFATFEIRLDPFSANQSNRVDINGYYIVLGCDSTGYGVFASTHYACIQLKDYYSAEDIGTWKRINVPLSQFDRTKNSNVKYVMGNKESWGVGCPADYLFTRVCSLGIVAYATEEVRSWDQFNNLYLDNMAILSGYPNVAPPKRLIQTESTASSITLSWVKSPIASKYEIERSDGKIFSFNADTDNYTDTGLVPCSQYTYKMRIMDRYGTFSDFSDPTVGFASPVGRPLNLKANLVTGDLAVRLSWESPSYGIASVYKIFRDGTLIKEVEGTLNEYVDCDNLEEYKIYNYYVISADENGYESLLSNEIKFLVTAVAMPAGLSATITGDKEIKLSWGAVSGAASYLVYCNGIEIAEVTDAMFVHSSVKYDMTYRYIIKAKTAKGSLSPPSEETIAIIKNPELADASIVFNDALTAGVINTTGAVTTGGYSSQIGLITDYYIKGKITDEQVINGQNAIKAEFEPHIADNQILSFKKDASGYSFLGSMRANGNGSLCFLLYAPNETDLEDIFVGFDYERPRVGTSIKDMIRCLLPLGDYCKTVGEWVSVEVPIADFPQKGEFIVVDNPMTDNYLFEKTTQLSFVARTQTSFKGKTIYLDDVRFATFNAPAIKGVFESNGNSVQNASVISANTNLLKIKFDKEMNAGTLNTDNLILKNTDADKVIDTYGTYNKDTFECELLILEQLPKSSNYTFTVKNVKSLKGAEMPAYSLSFKTDSSEPDANNVAFPAQTISLSNKSVKVGQSAQITVAVENFSQIKNNIRGIELEIDYNDDLLEFTNVSFNNDFADKNPASYVSVSGKVSIRVPVNIEALWSGNGTLCTVNFSAKSSGSCTLGITGSAAMYSSASKCMKNADIEKTGGSITIAKGGNGGGGGGGGGIPADIARQTPAPLPTQTNNSSEGNPSELSDIAEFSWAEEAIGKLYEKGLVTGYPDGTFKPAGNITRAEFITMLCKALKIVDETADSSFSDAAQGEWYYKYIASAEVKGVIKGKENGSFGINDPITRQDACVMIFRALGEIKLSDKYDSATFIDQDAIASYASDAINKLQKSGIINGVGDNSFDPNGVVNRAMAAKMLFELLKEV